MEQAAEPGAAVPTHMVIVLAITEVGWRALQDAVPRMFVAEKEFWRAHCRAELRQVAELLAPLVE